MSVILAIALSLSLNSAQLRGYKPLKTVLSTCVWGSGYIAP